MANGEFYINLGGGLADIGAVRFGFRAPVNAYDNIAGYMGVVPITDVQVSGVLFGANSPRPGKVRISYRTGGLASTRRGAIRYCEPDKLGDVTVGGAINGQQVVVNGAKYEIDFVTIKN